MNPFGNTNTSTDEITQSEIEHLEYRRPLQIFFSYRFLLATLLTLLFFIGTGPSLLGRSYPLLYGYTTVIYLVLVFLSGLLIDHGKWVEARHQAFLMVFIDICAITLLMHASGGVKSGLGMLIALSIVAGSLITKGKWAGLLAALATLSVLTEEIYSDIILQLVPTYYTQAGLLGGAFFAIALLSLAFSRQIQKSEQLVSQAESDLLNMEQLNEYIIQHMQTGILVVDTNQEIRLMNQAAWYLLGMPDKGTSHQLSEVCPELKNQLEERGLDYTKENIPFRATADGRELTAGFSGLGHNGKNGVVIFLEDTASITQQAQQIKLASLGRLTASIAHEIRNPLGAISHAEQLLRESPKLPSGDQRLIDIIHSNTIRVNEIIETILNLSRRDRSLPEEFILASWLETQKETIIANQESSNINLTLEIHPENTLVRTDKSQFKQVLSILCDNALKHSGTVNSVVDLQMIGGITKESGSPFLDIIDNGPGIPQDIHKHIFEPFFSSENKSTGLGLYIAKELCESNKLGIEYIDRPDKGSCFRITFPGRGNKPLSA